MTQLASEAFTDTNGTSLSAHGNWSTVTGNSQLEVQSNQCEPSNYSVDCANRYNGITWPNNQYAQFTLKGMAPGSSSDVGLGIGLRFNTGGANSYYRLIPCHTSNGNTEISKFVSGSYTQLASGAYNSTPASGHVIYGEVQGTTLLCKQNGSTVLSTTDSSLSSGQAGVFYSGSFSSGTAPLDDWLGGDFGGLTITVSLRSAIQKAFTKTTSMQSALQKTLTISADLAAAIQKELAISTSLQSFLQAQFQLSTSLQAALQKEFIATASLQGALQDTFQITTALQAALQKQGLFISTSLAGALVKEFLVTTTMQAALQKAFAITAILQGALQRQGLTISTSLQAYLINQFIALNVSLQAAIQKQDLVLSTKLQTYLSKKGWQIESAPTDGWTIQTPAAGASLIQ